VALKILPSEVAQLPDRRERFEREAKAIAALNHPNIVTVHAVQQIDDVHFIAMEFVRGKALTHAIPKRGFTLDRFFDLAIPLADAVAAAHQIGIVHRDLKPDNVMVTEDGRVKVLDFGVAKLQAASSHDAAGDVTRAGTRQGEIVGTIAYMSPEQAEGKSVDTRSDVFSLGIVFYEMLTGQRPFRGDTSSALLAAIIRDTPPPAGTLNRAIPADLEKLLARCLRKDPARRLQSALELRNQLEEINGSRASVAAESRSSWRRGGFGIIAAIVTVLGALAATAYLLTPARSAGLRFDRPVQLTTAAGQETAPSWSPDGTLLAFESNQSGNWDILVTQVTGGAVVNLTADHRGNDRFPSWSPDGKEIAFVSTREGRGVFVMPALGGPARKILSLTHGFEDDSQLLGAPQWAFDGSALTVVHRPVGEVTSLMRFSFASQTTTSVVFPGRCFDMSLSSDGRFVACAEGGPTWETTELWIAPASGGQRVALSRVMGKYASPSWSKDGRSLFYTSNRHGSVMDLWRQRLGRDGETVGEPERLTAGVGALNAQFSPDGTRLAYARGQTISNVWRVPILEHRPATWSDAVAVTSEHARVAHVDISPDGKQLVLSSSRLGSPDLWLLPTDGGEFRRLTTDAAEERGPQFSSDGEQIAFHSLRSGNRDIWIVPAGGGPARALAVHPATDWFPTWSPDDQEIAFISDRAGKGTDIWVVPAAGGEPRPVTDHPAQDEWPLYSPDGESIFFFSTRTTPGRLFRTPRTGGPATPLTKGPSRVAAWAPDGRTLYFHGLGERSSGLWALSLADQREFQVADLNNQQRYLDVSSLATDGRYLYVVMVEDQSDLWVMNVAEER
jgi:Tol biopolymer transport system component